METHEVSVSAELGFTGAELAALERIEGLLAVRMKEKPRRHVHSLGVARTAVGLARAYGVDAFDAAVAGFLHDWDKVVEDGELVARAVRYRIPIEGSPALAAPLLHGPVAARELPELFPELDRAVFQAIDRHTVGALDMGPLDMVVFVADAIEPGRRGSYADDLRTLVGEVDLERLFFTCFAQGLVYVIGGGRYLYPTALPIYNRYALAQKR